MGYLETYREKHRHPVNRLLHTFGIPAVVLSVLLFVAFLLGWVHWWIPAALFVGGWILQFAGHAVEGNSPAFFSNPLYLLVGPFWWLKKVFGSVPPAASRRPLR